MADDFVANPGAGGDTFAADDIAGVKYPRSKLVIGADGVNDGDVSATNPLPVNLEQVNGGSIALGAGSTSVTTIRVTVASDSSGQIAAIGKAAHDAAISGNPVRIGARAATADYTSVADGDTADLLCDTKGKQIVLPYALHENHWQYAGAAITDTADDAVKASAGAGLRNYVTSLTVINSHATVGTVVELKDGSTVVHRGYAAPLGGGYTVTFPTALKGTAATAINVACVTTGSNTYVNASGYVAP